MWKETGTPLPRDTNTVAEHTLSLMFIIMPDLSAIRISGYVSMCGRVGGSERRVASNE